MTRPEIDESGPRCREENAEPGTPEPITKRERPNVNRRPPSKGRARSGREGSGKKFSENVIAAGGCVGSLSPPFRRLGGISLG